MMAGDVVKMWWWWLVILLGLSEAASRGSRKSSGSVIPLLSISAVEGRPIELPCNITAPGHDTLDMVIWFKEGSTDPIYTVDFRERSDEPSHKSAFGKRANFRTAVQEPAVLMIDDIKRHDAAIYKCRVDFNREQSRIVRYNLSVIIPPGQPEILDMWGRALNGSLGPYGEGNNLSLTCRVTGGKPQPSVKWFVNGKLRNDDNFLTTGDVIEKKLTIKSLNRSHLFSNFTCEANNTNLIRPSQVTLILDLNLKPLTVAIRKLDGQGFGNESLKAGERYEMECETTGSRPSAIITWWKGTRNLKHVKEEKISINTENRTISTVEFVPGVDDDGKTVICRAENPNVNGLYLESTWRINVVYAPIVSLKLGSTLSPEDIKEGDDVYFECQIRANPPWAKLAWIHNSEVLTHNKSARIVWSNQSLVLQSVTKSSAGVYVCAATNSIQETRSEPLQLRVKYAPVCKKDKIMIVGASRSESLEIACQVEADPPARSFRWKFNNSGETLDVASKSYSLAEGVSVLTYMPSSELDYGTLSCWAENVVGVQAKPCLFQIVAAGKPYPVRNCSLANQTYTSVEVKCHAGYDGGLPQEFVLEVYHGDVDSLVALRPLYNVTAKEEPVFVLSGLQASVDAGVHVAIYAVNAKGRSQSIILSEVTFRDAERRTGTDEVTGMSPLVGVLIGVLATLVLIISALVVRARREEDARIKKTRHNGEKPTSAELSELPGQQLYPMQNVEQTAEIDPDVIPNKFEGNLIEISPPSYPTRGYPPGQWVTPGPNPSIDELCHKFTGRPTDLRLPSRSTTSLTAAIAPMQPKSLTGVTNPGTMLGPGPCVVVAGECLDGEAIKRRLMANRLPESCV